MIKSYEALELQEMVHDHHFDVRTLTMVSLDDCVMKTSIVLTRNLCENYTLRKGSD